MNSNLEQLQQALGYTFRDGGLLRQAMTHASFAKGENQSDAHNQRMEFLGDAVLELCVSEMLYRAYDAMDEGDLTRTRSMMVRETALTALAKKLRLGEYLWLGKGEEKTGGREKPSILADCFEAVLGAMYLDGGLEAAKGFLRPLFELNDPKALDDYKTILQEKLQKKHAGPLEYAIVSASGPDHDLRFHVRILIQSEVFGEGWGDSKKEAEQRAARETLRMMNLL